MLAARSVVSAFCLAKSSHEARPARQTGVAGANVRKDSRRDVLLFAGVLAGSAFLRSDGANAVECSIRVPCMIMPKDGKPRYEMPGSQYDPAKEAEKRYMEKMQAKAAAAAAQEADKPE